MKKALFASAVVFTLSSAFAQSSWTDGQLNFKTAAIQKLDGSGSYNVPLYLDDGFGTAGSPAGTYRGGVTVGLFLPGSQTPFVTGQLGTSGVTALYVASPAPSQTVSVPGQPIGSTPTIFIRAWSTASGSFNAAQIDGGVWGEWSITTKPLGGTPAGGGTPITPPSLSGWGIEAGSPGFVLNSPEPSTIALSALGIAALVLIHPRK